MITLIGRPEVTSRSQIRSPRLYGDLSPPAAWPLANLLSSFLPSNQSGTLEIFAISSPTGETGGAQRAHTSIAAQAASACGYPDRVSKRRRLEYKLPSWILEVSLSLRIIFWLTLGVSSFSHDVATSSDDTETEDEWYIPRGRSFSQSTARPKKPSSGHTSRPLKRSSPNPSVSSSSRSDSPAKHHRRTSFTRSRSPAYATLANGVPPESHSQAVLSAILTRNKLLSNTFCLLPTRLRVSARLPGFGPWTFSIDARVAAESSLLLVSLAGVTSRISQYAQDMRDVWVQRELYILMILSLMYLIWMHSSVSKQPDPPTPAPPPSPRPPGARSLRVADPRDGRRGAPIPVDPSKDEFGYIWMTVPKNYRNCSDDGIFSSLVIGPMISAAMLYSALCLAATPVPPPLLPPTWRIELPLVQSQAPAPLNALQAMVQARRVLVDLGTLCPTILLIHVCSSWWTEHLYRKVKTVPEGERGSVPRKESKRLWRYTFFSLAVSLALTGIRALMPHVSCGIWQNMSYLDLLAAAVFFQFTLYAAIRLAHQGFSLGELGLVCFGATVLFVEMVNLTAAQMWPTTIQFIQTFRLPTPLLIFQLALIPGALLTGFLLSPLLVLSRQLAQQPVRRLRHPQQKQKHRRMLAAGFYLGTVLVGGGLVSFWTRACLGGRNPWLWAILYLFEGRRRWSRPVLLAYWATLGSISVAGWTRQLARSRRYRPRTHASGGSAAVGADTPPLSPSGGATDVAGAPPSTDVTGQIPPVGGMSGNQTLGLAFSALPTLPNLPNLSNGAGMSQAATEFFDAADKRVPLLSLNARRKFFHGLAVAMFVPGIALDPAFMHLAFSAAFALFTFSEYVRYFALYPFGAAVHVFMNEFLDAKDSGTAVLSHFYLLTGCAGALWLEAPSLILQFTGVLTLGVGDAVASIVGKRIGRHRWSPTTPKTIEGSVAFTVSVAGCAWVLRLCGVTEAFSMLRYTIAIAWGAALEALSVQNDNLTLPLYIWSVLSATAV